MITNVAGKPGVRGLTDEEIAAVAGGIVIFPESPPFQKPHWPRTDPLPPPGGSTP